MSTEKQPNKSGEKFIKKTGKKKIKRKWMVYLITYIIGYILSVCYTGIPNIVYLIPLKLNALCASMFIGHMFSNPPRLSGESNKLYIGRCRGDAAINAIIFIVIMFAYLAFIRLLFIVHIIPSEDPFMH